MAKKKIEASFFLMPFQKTNAFRKNKNISDYWAFSVFELLKKIIIRHPISMDFFLGILPAINLFLLLFYYLWVTVDFHSESHATLLK
jgi:hypothetical protein